MRGGKPIRLRDFIEVDGLYFSVVGYKNSKKIKCLLRYVPDESGDRVKDGVRYKKLSHKEAVNYPRTKKYYDNGIFRVPIDEVDRVYKPEERLKDVKSNEVKKIVEYFDLVPISKMGVTGSRLIGLEGKESDVDFIVYGKWWFAAREKIRKGIEKGTLQEPDEETWDFIYRKRKITMPYNIFLEQERRKYHRAFLGSTYFDLLYVRDYGEMNKSIPEDPGKKLGKFTLEAEVLDDSLIFDYPAYYPVKHSEVKAVLCFTHTYVGQAFKGELLRARGDLEEINGEKYLVVGTRREVEDEYIVSLSLIENLGLVEEFKEWCQQQA